MNTIINGYTAFIEWSAEDNVYIVTVPDLPGCMTHGATYQEAIEQGKDAIATWLMDEDMEASA